MTVIIYKPSKTAMQSGKLGQKVGCWSTSRVLLEDLTLLWAGVPPVRPLTRLN